MRTTLAAATALASLALLAAPAAATERVKVDEGLVTVDDFVEGEAPHFVDLRFDSCRSVTGPVTVQINGETTEGRQYALEATRPARGGAQVSFAVHAGTYRLTAFPEGSSSHIGGLDVRADDASATSLRLSTLCGSAAATSSRPRVPTRIDTGVGPVGTGDPAALPAVVTGAVALTGGALLVGGLSTVRRRASRP